MYQLIDPIFGDGVDGNGVLTGVDAPIDSACTGTVGTKTLTATNVNFSPGQMVLVHQTRGTGAGQWEVNKISSYSAGNMGLEHNLSYEYVSGAQVIVRKQYRKVTMSGSFTGKDWDGSVGGIITFMADSLVLVSNTISGVACGFRGSTIAGADSSTAGQGEGTAGDRNGLSAAANGNGAGGAVIDTGFKPGGGGGGNSVVGNNGANAGTSTGGVGGNSVGIADLTSMNLGGGGSSTGYDGSGGDRYLGNDGGGLFFVTCREYQVTGAVNMDAQTNAGSGGVTVGGGGGGAGGCDLIQTIIATLGANLVTAIGKPGRTATASSGDGGPGSPGYVRVEAPTITGTTNPSASATGNVIWAGVCP